MRKIASELEAHKKQFSDKICLKWLEDVTGRSTIIAVNQETSGYALDKGMDAVEHERPECQTKEEEVHQCDAGDDYDVSPSFSSWGSYTADERKGTAPDRNMEIHKNKKQQSQELAKDSPEPLVIVDNSDTHVSASTVSREDHATQTEQPPKSYSSIETESLLAHNMLKLEKIERLQTSAATDTNGLEDNQAALELSELRTQLGTVQKALEDQQHDNSVQRYEQHQSICDWKEKCDEVLVQKAEIKKQANLLEKCVETMKKDHKDWKEKAISDQEVIKNLTSDLKSAVTKSSKLEEFLEEEKKSHLDKTLGDSNRFVKFEKEACKLQERVKEIMDEKNFVEEEVSRLKRLLEQRDKSLKSGKLTLQQKVQSARDENMDSIKKVAELSDRVKTLEAENSILACQKDDLAGTIVELQNDLSTRAQEHQLLKSCLKDKDSCISDTQGQIKILKQGNSSLNERLKRMERMSMEANRARELCKGKIKELENKLHEMEMEKDKCDGKIRKMKEKLTLSSTQTEALQAQHAEDNAKFEEADIKAKANQDQITDLTEALKQKDKELLDTKQRYYAGSNANSVLQGKLGEEHAEVMRLKSELDKKSAKLETGGREFSQMKSTLQDVQCKMKRLEKYKQECMREQEIASQKGLLAAKELLEKEKELQICRKDLDHERKALILLEQQKQEAVSKLAHIEGVQKDQEGLEQHMHIQITTLEDQLKCQYEVNQRLEASRLTQEKECKASLSKISDLQKLVELQEAELQDIQARRLGAPGFVQELLADKNERHVTSTKLQNIARKLEMKTGLSSDPTPLQVIQCIHRILAQLEDHCEQYKVRRPRDSARIPADGLMSQSCSYKAVESTFSIPTKGKSETHCDTDSQQGNQWTRAAQTMESGSSKAIASWQHARKRNSQGARVQNKGMAPLRHPQKLILLN